MQRNVLNNIRDGHQGISKCCTRARTIWWPYLSRDIESFVKLCSLCAKYRANPTGPLLQTVLPDRSWQKVAAICFILKIVCIYWLLIIFHVGLN